MDLWGWMTRSRFAWLPIAALVASSSRAAAQVQGPAVSVGSGVDLTTRHVGLALEGRVSQEWGRWDHQLGVSASLAPMTGLDLCRIAPDGGCVPADPYLLTAFYEPRVRTEATPGNGRAYVGGRVSFVRGWNGVGAALGAVLGVEATFAGRGLVRFDGIADYIVTRASGDAGVSWNSPRIGVRIGAGFRM